MIILNCKASGEKEGFSWQQTFFLNLLLEKWNFERGAPPPHILGISK